MACISLPVRAVGIVPFMTIAAVSERTAEIDPRMALGSQRRMILRPFLGDAMVLALPSGLLSVASGDSLAQQVSIAVPVLPVSTPLLYVLLSLGSSALIGLAAGFSAAAAA